MSWARLPVPFPAGFLKSALWDNALRGQPLQVRSQDLQRRRPSLSQKVPPSNTMRTLNLLTSRWSPDESPKGKNAGIDASIIEANAALKSLINRNTAETYWEYVQRLAKANGIDPQNSKTVRQFDRKRPKRSARSGSILMTRNQGYVAGGQTINGETQQAPANCRRPQAFIIHVA